MRVAPLTAQLPRTAGLAAAALVLMAALGPAPAPVATADAVRPAVPNPDIVEDCGVDVTLILDASGSIQDAGAVDDVRDAAEAFLVALADTSSTARVIDFGSNARQTAAKAIVTTASLGPGGTFRQAIQDYYNPIPPFRAGGPGPRLPRRQQPDQQPQQLPEQQLGPVHELGRRARPQCKRDPGAGPVHHGRPAERRRRRPGR